MMVLAIRILACSSMLFAAACGAEKSNSATSPAGLSADDGAMRLVILGTGTPNPDPARSGPALAVIKNGHAYLFDAGPGIVRRAAAAATASQIDALLASNLDTVFLTHLHSDHTLGLPELMFGPWPLGRATPLHLYGPPGVAAMAQHITEAYDLDIRMRIDGLEPINEDGYKYQATEIDAGGVVFQYEDVTVEAIPVLHGSWEYAYGYKVTDGDRTIVISGDARPSPALIEAARGADILIHEVYSKEQFAHRTPEWQAYHSSFHTSTEELANIAAETKPKQLILYHQLYWGADDEALLREIKSSGYDGATASASDLDVY